MVSAVIDITQYATEDQTLSLREKGVFLISSAECKQQQAFITSNSAASHLHPVTQPIVREGLSEWETGNKFSWSDSPNRQPFLLYRQRFSWGRDERELFSYRGLPVYELEDEGQRLGNMDNSSGLLTYFRINSLSSTSTIRLFKISNLGRVKLLDFDIQNKFEHIYELGKISSEADINQFPFLLTAKPEPFSIKNPIDTDVFIRLSNYSFPLSSGTITLQLNDILQDNLQIDEFFTGLGGFDVTWNNNFVFDYDERVDVRWEFRDTALPSNKFIVAYPFYTVLDLIGPRVTNLVPQDLSENVPINGPIQFDVEDFENDVDITTLVIYVNNVLITNEENGVIELSRFQNEKGYTVKITLNDSWLYGDLIPVAIFINDTSANKNETFFTYSFTTIESNAPRILNLNPSSCSISIPVESDISLDIIDGGHGLDKSSILFAVDEKEQGGFIKLIPIVHRDE